MQNLLVTFTFSVSDRKYFFFGKFDPKNQNCQFKLKFGTYTNSNTQNSMVIFTFSVFDRKYLFWANLVQKIKFVNLTWNLVLRLIQICRIQLGCSLFPFSMGNTFFGQLVQKIKIVNLTWNLVPRLIQIYRSQWRCSLFLFSTVNTFFVQIWSKKSKLSVYDEIWYLD